MKCKDCKYYRPFKEKYTSDYEDNGLCHRMPETINKDESDFCGEFVNDED